MLQIISLCHFAVLSGYVKKRILYLYISLTRRSTLKVQTPLVEADHLLPPPLSRSVRFVAA